MINKSLFIKNPLTVIAIFASLTEVVCGTVTPFITNIQNQQIFLIFVIGFPISIVILFFLTLNFNHKVLYSPSDFSDSNQTILSLFYNKKINEIEKETLTNNIEKGKNYLKDLNFEDLDNETRPFYIYAKEFYYRIEDSLPSDKIKEINFDPANHIVHTLEIRIKQKFLNKGEINRFIFVLYLYIEEKYDSNKGVFIKDKNASGFIAGSGKKVDGSSPEYLSSYVIYNILDKLIKWYMKKLCLLTKNH